MHPPIISHYSLLLDRLKAGCRIWLLCFKHQCQHSIYKTDRLFPICQAHTPLGPPLVPSFPCIKSLLDKTGHSSRVDVVNSKGFAHKSLSHMQEEQNSDPSAGFAEISPYISISPVKSFSRLWIVFSFIKNSVKKQSCSILGCFFIFDENH